MVTKKEIEMLAGLLSRAGVTPVEAAWANRVLDELRKLVAINDSPKPDKEKEPEH